MYNIQLGNTEVYVGPLLLTRVKEVYVGPLLLTRVNLNPCVDK